MREQESGSSRTKVQVRHLTKKFGDLLVLDDISPTTLPTLWEWTLSALGTADSRAGF